MKDRLVYSGALLEVNYFMNVQFDLTISSVLISQ